MPTLWNSLPRVNSDPLGAFLAPAKTVQLRSLLSASLFEDLQGLRGRKVLLAVRSQLARQNSGRREECSLGGSISQATGIALNGSAG